MTVEKSKRPTLADHDVRLGSLQSTIDAVAAQVTELRQPTKRDVEADVVGRCAQALDSLKERTSGRDSGYAFATLSSSHYAQPSYQYQPLYTAPSGPVPRVLDYLRQRYGIPDPSAEAQRLSAELQRAYQRIGELEGRLEQIRGASA